MTPETVGVLTGFFGLFVTAGTFFIGIYWLLRWLDKRITWLHRAKDTLDVLPKRLDDQDTQIEAIVADLRPNGGKSMRDAAVRMEKAQTETNRMLTVLNERVERLEQSRWPRLFTTPRLIGRGGTETETQP